MKKTRGQRRPGQKYSSYYRSRLLANFCTQGEFGASFMVNSFAREQMTPALKSQYDDLSSRFWAIKKDGPVSKKLQREFHRFHDELQVHAFGHIRELFEKTTEVQFYARTFNHLEYRYVGLEGSHDGLPLKIFFSALGTKVGTLRTIFSRGYNAGADNPYDRLGYFPLADRYFVKLARLLGKPVKVMREDGSDGSSYYLFTAQPDGTIVEPEAKAA